MKPALLICGYGSGISRAVAERFGREGHPVHLVARDDGKLAQAQQSLQNQGIRTAFTVCDLGNDTALAAALDTWRAQDIGLLHWNAFTDIDGNLLAADSAVLLASLNLRVVSYLRTVQILLPALARRRGAVLATGGIMALQHPDINAFAQDFGILSVSVAAQHKANALLAPRLAAYGVHLAEIIVNGFVRNTPAEAEYGATLHPADIAERFWEMAQARQAHSCIFGGKI